MMCPRDYFIISLVAGTCPRHPSLAEWPYFIFHHLFLIFFLSHSEYQITINTSHFPSFLLFPLSVYNTPKSLPNTKKIG